MFTQSYGWDLVVDRHHSNVEVIDRKRAMQGDGWGESILLAAAIYCSSLSIWHNESDNVRDRIGSNLTT